MGNGGDDFQTAELDSIENVIGLSPKDPLNGFAGKISIIRHAAFNFKQIMCSFLRYVTL